MPDVEALAETVRAKLEKLVDASEYGDDGWGRQLAREYHDEALAALDGLVEAAGKAEAGRASAAPESPVSWAGAGAEDTVGLVDELADAVCTCNSGPYGACSYCSILGRIRSALSTLVEAVRQRDAAAELVVQATVLPLAGSWESGYRLDTAFPQTAVSALPSEWAEAATAVSELHALIALSLSHRGEPK